VPVCFVHRLKKSAFVETKHGYDIVFNHGFHGLRGFSQIVQTGNFVVEFEKKER